MYKKTRVAQNRMSTSKNIDTGKRTGRKKHISYAALISQALLNSANNRLTLKEIYHFISTNYPEYTMHKQGWQNSIRHNLSLNKAFYKEPKVKGTPGKGSYWSIDLKEAKAILDKSDRSIRTASRIRRGYGHTNNCLSRKRSPFLEDICISDDKKKRAHKTIIFNGDLNPYNESLEAFFGLPNHRDNEDGEDGGRDRTDWQNYCGVNSYFKF